MALAAGLAAQAALAQPPSERQKEYLKFIKAQAKQLRSADKPPATRAEWEAQSRELRDNLQHAFGPFPQKPCPLEPKVLGVLQRDGYRIEKILFQTLPGVWMTANAYVPARPERFWGRLVFKLGWHLEFLFQVERGLVTASRRIRRLSTK